MGLIRRLDRGPVALDTVIFIHWIEDHERWARQLEPLFAAIDDGRLEATTCTLTLAEVLVVPYRRGHAELARRYEEFLRRGRGLTLVPLDYPILRGAALLRAHYAIRTPDALHLAAALARGCRSFLTNDRRLPNIPGLRVVQLDER